MTPTATASSSVLDQLGNVLAQLEKVREVRGWGRRDCARMLNVSHGNISSWITRASDTTTLPTLDAYARELGHALQLRLVEDSPGEPSLPWRERMPHGEDPLDPHAMGAVWRLQQQLAQIRWRSGRSRPDLAAALGIQPLALWRLESSPNAADSALINVLVFARFFSHRIVFELEPLDPGSSDE